MSVNTNKTEKDKALEAAMAQIQKQFGKGAIMKLGDESAQMNIDAISSGSISLDIATGIGGVPKGRIVEIYGPESSGKTTLTLHMIAEAQKAGGKAAFIDAEHALDPVYARNLGVDVGMYCWCPSRIPASRHWKSAICWCAAARMDVVVVDSVAALVPKAEIRRRDGRQPCRSAGKTDVAGFAQDCRYGQQVQHLCNLYQPAA